MLLKSLEVAGFKSFAKKDALDFTSPITAIVGPNGSGKSNVAEAFRFVLGEQSMKSMRGKRGEDLIFNGSPSSPRANRAGVKIVFDNRSRFLKTDFDEIAIERVVHRDGVNQYLVNGSAVRLKDVFEILAGGNIGSSGHHIISQGEADRVLSASPSDRREMIEDALGLKIYQYKREEAERKLEKTRENIGQVASLRREIAPHLAFLKRQMEKVERVAKLRAELRTLYLEYLARESAYLAREERRIEESRKAPVKRLRAIEGELTSVKAAVARAEASDEKKRDILALEREIAGVRTRREKSAREVGRIEGQIEYAKRSAATLAEAELSSVPLAEVEALVEDIAGRAERLRGNESVLRVFIQEIAEKLRGFLSGRKSKTPRAQAEEEIEGLSRECEKARRVEQSFGEEERALLARLGVLREETERTLDETRSAERDMFRLMTEQSEVRAVLASLESAWSALVHSKEEFVREVNESVALIGRDAEGYKTHRIVSKDGEGGTDADAVGENRGAQEERRRALEKMKIRIEESGAGSADEVEREYKEVSERDAFLGKEVADLEQSASSLEALIADLAEKLTTQFKEGVGRINTEFQNFFALMFGGGTARLDVIVEKRRRRGAEEEGGEDDEEVEEGVDISVSLPAKRVRGLDMLSGGERALTSIALIFAMSQVNPPPFIILDETDAALDEANSRRYGDMIENLAKKSQLILITHNRETMSRAGVLYGVTMGRDGISKLLSVKFDEAVAVAK